MRKILIGVGGKECSLHAVEFVEKQVRTGEDLEVTLAHVLPNLPAVFWDEGHILSTGEQEDRKRVVDTWISKQRAKIEPLLKNAAESLAKAGIRAEKTGTKFISDSTDVADSLLEAAKDGGYQMIVVGRQCSGPAARPAAGDVPAKLLRKAVGVSIVVVD